MQESEVSVQMPRAEKGLKSMQASRGAGDGAAGGPEAGVFPQVRTGEALRDGGGRDVCAKVGASKDCSLPLSESMT